MQRANVLVLGNSGVGKSTLINAVLGKDVAKTGWGTAGTTQELEIYESENLPFRIIDSVGFEPSFLKQQKAIGAVKKWSKNSARDGADQQINVIWFCVDGTSSKLFPETIRNLSRATAMWPTVPVIVVITKSYSVPERAQNVAMVQSAFEEQKRYAEKLRGIIPVVASPYVVNETAFAAPEGITELIDATNAVLPEGVQAALTDISRFNLSRKRALAQSIIGVATTAGVVVGAVPIPFADAMLLSPIEIAEINGLAAVYGLEKDGKAKQFISSIVEVGTVSLVARAALSGLKMIPGINLATSALNAIVAGVFVALIGEGTVYVFERIYAGEKTLDDLEWAKRIIEDKLTSELLEKVKAATEQITDKTDKKDMGKIIAALFEPKKK
ncbi:MAG: 50S ribosome-binding GTPase [Clostridia bacterium]|nr:50S ribosome-binding GTPase [Clostridia bacterium]